MAHVSQQSITQLTTTGASDWIDLTTIPNSAVFELVWVNAGSAVANFEYSEDGSTVVADSEATASLTNAGTVTLAYPVATVYRYVRINWTGGTATSLDAVLKGNIIR